MAAAKLHPFLARLRQAKPAVLAARFRITYPDGTSQQFYRQKFQGADLYIEVAPGQKGWVHLRERPRRFRPEGAAKVVHAERIG